jgi:hypothetical protein
MWAIVGLLNAQNRTASGMETIPEQHTPAGAGESFLLLWFCCRCSMSRACSRGRHSSPLWRGSLSCRGYAKPKEIGAVIQDTAAVACQQGAYR